MHYPTPRFTEKGNLEVLLFTIQSKMRANNQKVYTPREGRLISDINKVSAVDWLDEEVGDSSQGTPEGGNPRGENPRGGRLRAQGIGGGTLGVREPLILLNLMAQLSC